MIQYTSVHPYSVISRTRWCVLTNITTLTILQRLVLTCERRCYAAQVRRCNMMLPLGYDTGSTLIHGTEVLVLWFKEDDNSIIDCYQNSAFIFIRTKTLRLAHSAWSFYVLLIFRCKRSVLQTTVIYNQVYEAGYRVNHCTKWSSEFTWFWNVIISDPWVQYPNNHS